MSSNEIFLKRSGPPPTRLRHNVIKRSKLLNLARSNSPHLTLTKQSFLQREFCSAWMVVTAMKSRRNNGVAKVKEG